MPLRMEEMLSQRTDISRYLVHLTRRTENGSARDNLLSILQDRQIRAFSHHCLFSRRLDDEDVDIQERFHVACFTETPLDKLHLLTDVANRSVELEPYGVVFSKKAVRASRGNPVFYVYEENHALQRLLWSQYRSYIHDARDGEVGQFHTLGAIVNVVKEGHDFHWEREWRTRGGFQFKYVNLFAVVAPRNQHRYIRNRVGAESIDYVPFIDANWNMEEILAHLANHMWNQYLAQD